MRRSEPAASSSATSPRRSRSFYPGERLRLRALGEDDAVLTETVVQPEVRMGGNERCGGPTEATEQLAG